MSHLQMTSTIFESRETADNSILIKLLQPLTTYIRVRFLRGSFACDWSEVAFIRVVDGHGIQGSNTEPESTKIANQVLPQKPTLGRLLKGLFAKDKGLQTPVVSVELSTEHVIIKWSPVEKATHYQIAIRLPTGKIWHSKPIPANNLLQANLPRAKFSVGVYQCQVAAIDSERKVRSQATNTATFTVEPR